MEIDLTSFSVTPTSQQQNPSPSPRANPQPAPGVEWGINQKERSAYETRFTQLAQDSDSVSGKDAVPFLALSKLPTDTLRKIWELSDQDQDGRLSKPEFLIAMHLVMKARAGVAIPLVLPEALVSFLQSQGARIAQPVPASPASTQQAATVTPTLLSPTSSQPPVVILATPPPPPPTRPPAMVSEFSLSAERKEDSVTPMARREPASSPVKGNQKRLSLAETLALGTGTGVDVNKKFVPPAIKAEMEKILNFYKGDTSLFNRALLSFISENAKSVGVVQPSWNFSQKLFHYHVDEEIHDLLADLDAKKGNKRDVSEEKENGGDGSDGEAEQKEDDAEADGEVAAGAASGLANMIEKVKQATLRSAHLEAMAKRNEDNQKQLMEIGDKMGLVSVHIVEGWALKGMGSSRADAFCEVYVLSTEKDIKDLFAVNTFTTRILSKDGDPFWNEECKLLTSSRKDVVVIDVHHFSSTITHKRIGRVLVPIAALSKKRRADSFGTEPALEGWFPLLDITGQISTHGSIYLKLVLTRNLPRDVSEWVPCVEMQPEKPAVLSVFTGTWNLGNMYPPDDLNLFIPVGPHDVYVIATQECKYQPRFDHNACRDDWLSVLTKHFGSQYTMVKYHSLWAIRLAVFVAKQHLTRIHGISFHSEATGVGSVLGNKGACLTAFEIDHRPVCFIGAHLAAHQDKVAARNDNIRLILKASKVGRFYCDGSRIDPVNQFDHLIFMGDLNYRIAFGDQPTKTPPAPVFDAMVKKIHEGTAGDLLAVDQLKMEQAGNRALIGFKEYDMAFREGFKPTFKLEVGKALEYNSLRSPAWTDRVLWRSLPGLESSLRATSYAYCPAIFSSDHKPVCATFELESMVLAPAFDSRLGKCRVRFGTVKAVDLLSVEARAVVNEQHREALRTEAKKEKNQGGAAAAVKTAFKAIKSSTRASTTNPQMRCTAHMWGNKEYASAIAKDTLTPYWNNFEKKDCLYNNPERFQQSKLYIQVLSQNTVTIDQLGFGILNLQNFDILKLATAQHGKNVQVDFSLDLSYAGLPAGKLSGNVIFEWSSWPDRL